MANVKQYKIGVRLPFDWMHYLPASEVAAICGWMASPFESECRFSYTGVGYVPNEHGVRTSMFILTLEGESGASWVFLDRIVSAFHHAGWEVDGEACDIEDSSSPGWCRIEPDFDYEAYPDTTKPIPGEKQYRLTDVRTAGKALADWIVDNTEDPSIPPVSDLLAAWDRAV